MTGDPLRPIASGERRRSNAATHNVFVDMAKESRRPDPSAAQRRAPAVDTAGTLRVRNATGVDLPRFAVVAIGNPVFGPSDDLDEFLAGPVMEGAVPTASNKFAILQESIRAGDVGLAVAHGSTRVLVNATAATQSLLFAESSPTTGTRALVASSGGSAEILYRAPGTDDQWAEVRLDSSGAAMLLAVITSAGTETSDFSGIATTYGTTIESLFEASTGTVVVNQEFGQSSVRRFWLGEIVGVELVSGQWRPRKLLSLPVAYTATPSKVDLRLFAQVATASSSVPYYRPTRMLVDLAACVFFFESGQNTDEGYVAFAFDGYTGIGRIGVDLSCPVRHNPSGLATWNIASILEVDEDWDTARITILDGDPAQIESSQDTIVFDESEPYPPEPVLELSQSTYSRSVGTETKCSKWAAYPASGSTPPGFIDFQALINVPFGSPTLTNLTGATIRGQVVYNLQGSTAASTYWPGLAARPSLPQFDPGDSEWIPLGRVGAIITVSAITGGGSPDVEYPAIEAWRATVSSDPSIAGTCDLGVTAPAVNWGEGQPSFPAQAVQVEPWVEVST